MNGRDKRETGGHDVPQTPASVVRLPALSIREPWASLIADGKKSIEIRYWAKSFVRRAHNLSGQRIAIHASTTIDRQAVENRVGADHHFDFNPGCVIATAELAGVIFYNEDIPDDVRRFYRDKPLHLNPYMWVLPRRMCVGLKFVEPIRLQCPTPVTGRLGFFGVDLPADLAQSAIQAPRRGGAGAGVAPGPSSGPPDVGNNHSGRQAGVSRGGADPAAPRERIDS